MNFLTARDANLKPSATSHIDAIRQSDGSYTAYEVTDAAPYRTLNVTPHFERQFSACLPHTSPASSTTTPVANPPGAGSQLQASMTIANGNVFVASVGVNGVPLHFDLFDPQHNLLSETNFTYFVAEPFASPFNREDLFTSVALADMNGDGNPDLVAVFSTNRINGRIDGGVWVFPGNGDGTFGAGKRQVFNTTSTLLPASTAAIADLNGDGVADLVLPVPSTSDITIALGIGGGMFNPKTITLSIPGGLPQQSQRATALADLNGDGKPDLVAIANGLSGSAIAVALSNGDGTFQSAALYAALLPAATTFIGTEVAIGDMNGDHIPDIVTSGGTILFGDGKGAFPSRRDYPPSRADVGAVILSDFDGDGKTDIILGGGNAAYISGSAAEPTLTVLLASGGGLFNAAPAITGAPANASSVAVADFDNDGIADVAFLAVNSGTLQIAIEQGQGAGLFAPLASQSFVLPRIYSVRSGDFNHDGKQDLAVLSGFQTQNQLLIYAGRGNGAFDAAVTTDLGSASLIGIGDFNNDGIPDLITSGDFVSIWLGKGDATFTTHPTAVSAGDSPGATIGDFNGDGKPDLAIVKSGANTLTILPGKGDGTFQAPSVIVLPDAATGGDRSIAAADFDGDGHMDLAVELGAPGATTTPQLAILFGKGDGGFSSASLNPGLLPIQIADINGDKIPDLVGGGNNSGFGVRSGNGDGTFQSEYIVPAAGNPFTFVDFNRDGVPDIAGLSPSGSLIAFLNLSRPAPALTIVSAASFAPGPLAPGAIAAAFGENFAASASAAGSFLPYTLSGVTVAVQDSAGNARPAPLFFMSRNQFNFQVPSATAIGPATVTAFGTLSATSVTTQIQIAAIAPSLFTVGSGIAAAYAVQVAPDGSTTTAPVFGAQFFNTQSTIVPAPIDVTQPGQVFLILFGTGFDGATTASVSATVQGVPATVTYAGPQPTLTGLDQVNVLLPRSLAGTGTASVTIKAGGTVSNTVHIAVK